MKFLSVCIPTYEMKGLGGDFLKQSFDVLTRQTFKDFEVVVSDHSQNDVIKDLCETYRNKLDIVYHRNTEHLGSSSANLNNTIRKAHGKLIKFLMQDDFLYKEDALEEIVKNFDMEKDHWLITACEHTTDGVHFFRPFYPIYHDNIHLGRNTISSPSVLAIKNENPLFFDENLLQRTDGDYYKRCHDRFGDPKVLNSINVVNRAGPHQVSNTMITEPLKKNEYRYMLKKYHVKSPRIHMLMWYVQKYIDYSKRVFYYGKHVIRKII